MKLTKLKDSVALAKQFIRSLCLLEVSVVKHVFIKCVFLHGRPSLKSLKVAMFFLPILLKSPKVASSYGDLRSLSRSYEALAEKQLIKDIFSRRLSMKCIFLLWRLIVWILSLSSRSVQPFKITYPLRSLLITTIDKL